MEAQDVLQWSVDSFQTKLENYLGNERRKMAKAALRQIKAGGYVRVKLTGLVHAYRLFALPFDHVFDDGYDCVQDTEMTALLHMCKINAKSSIFVWHEYIAPREIKSARTMGGNTPPAKRRKS